MLKNGLIKKKTYMKTVSINEPCHENWAAMSPSEKGAFCGKCQIDVIDFSNKSPIEIKTILDESAGKHLCGRFKKTQLDDLNERYADWENQDSRTLMSKFLYALILVFGMTLFTGCADDEVIMGDVSIEEVYPAEGADSAIHSDQLEGHFENYGSAIEQDTPVYRQDRNHIKGKIAYNPEEELLGQVVYTPDTPRVIQPVIEPDERLFVKGEIAYIPASQGEQEEPIKPTCTIDTAETYIYGGFIAPVLPMTVDSTEQIDHIEPVVSPSETSFSIKLYPNPTQDIATVVVIVNAQAYFVADLYDMTGNKLARVYSGYLQEGIQRFDIAMAGYKAGEYLVTVSGPGAVQTVKILKVE
jgi:hypothetical protein